MIHIQKKYANAFAANMNCSKQISNDVWNFRCPVCGDSDKDPNKARGYIYQQSMDLFYKCHNCGDSRYFNSLLKEYDPALHRRYIAELFKHQRHPAKNKEAKEEAKLKNRPKQKIEKRLKQETITKKLRHANIVPVTESNIGQDYLLSRQIDKSSFHKIYFAENYLDALKLLKGETPDNKYHHLEQAAIAFLLYDEQGRFSGLQFRLLSKQTKKRFHIHKMRSSAQKLFFGNQYLKPNEAPKYVLEGAIDSLFLESAVASLGSDLICPFDSNETIYVLDFDNRNKQIVQKYKKLLEQGKRVCIPSTKYSHMDINDFILQGFSIQQIEKLIRSSAYSGLTGFLRLNEWKRI